jgi:asparagine synthase (glutamine-hydrolysing)
MCGLVGIISAELSKQDEMVVCIERMKAAIVHRGPDDTGIYRDPNNLPIVFGHCRLAIIDPEHGQQPMTTSDKMVTVVFNGAIYNYLELRRELISLGHRIHTYSDTEVILHAYTEWGMACVNKFNGMFAFAVWDKRNHQLFCARDRLGIKPFYYFFNGKRLIFASEIKAILAEGSLLAESNQEALQDYLTFQFCLGDKTLFKDIKKLEPGYWLLANLNSDSIQLKIQQYWDIQYDIDEKQDEAYFVDRLSMLLEDSVRLRLRSDVPLGAHLSGGLDSSTVTCIATSQLGDTQFDTFTGGFREGKQFDETRYARLVSETAGTKYHEIYPSAKNFVQILPKLMYLMDEPVAGPGVFPQYYVSKLAAEHVKVVLGGQGGDEIFMGYARYLVAYLEQCLKGAISQTANQEKYAVSLESIVPNLPVLQTYQPMLQHFWREGLFENQDQRYFRLIDRSEGMRHLFSPDIFSTTYASFASFQQLFNREGLHSLINRMSYFDLKASLPALLHVEDRTSMAVSLESRVPLLDYRIVELIARIPPNTKFAGGRLKHLFKEAVRHRVPKEIYTRKDKMGFPVPLNQWFQGTTREFVADILLSDKARQRGLYNLPMVEQAINREHQFGRVVWGLLCLELWHRIFIDGYLSNNFK